VQELEKLKEERERKMKIRNAKKEREMKHLQKRRKINTSIEKLCKAKIEQNMSKT